MAFLLGRRELVVGGALALACSRSGPAEGEPGVRHFSQRAPARVGLRAAALGARAGGRRRPHVGRPRRAVPRARRPSRSRRGREGARRRGDGLAARLRDGPRHRPPPRPPAARRRLRGARRAAPARRDERVARRAPVRRAGRRLPYLPDVHPAATGDIAEYTRFVIETLLPRVRAETPAIATADATGIDGVSLGGAEALRIGLGHAESFGAVGGIQPAVSDLPSADWTAMAQAARSRRPGLKLRLLTSHDDYFHESVDRRLARVGRRGHHARLRRRGRPPRLRLQQGPRLDRAPALARPRARG